MTLPRDVIPGRFYMITRRCTQRQFLLRPDAKVNNAFAYCLAVAAQTFEIDILLSCAMSNHHHTVVFDRHGRYPEFTEHFHKLLARALNAYRGRWENFWSSEQCCVVRLVELSDIVDKLVYVATNPVKSDLVEQIDEWPGFSSYRAMLSQEPIIATRPDFFFKASGTMPEKIALAMVIPPELGAAAEFLRIVQESVDKAVRIARDRRRAARRRVVGRNQICSQAWYSRPTSTEPRRELRPRIAARDLWVRLEVQLRNKEFNHEYQQARRALVRGEPQVFPVGTYWLKRFASVPIASATVATA